MWRDMNDQLYTRMAAAFVRGKHAQGFSIQLASSLLESALDDLSDMEVEDIVAAGKQAELRVHKFKRTIGLPRVRRVLGVLRQIAPSELLDVGSGCAAMRQSIIDFARDIVELSYAAPGIV